MANAEVILKQCESGTVIDNLKDAGDETMTGDVTQCRHKKYEYDVREVKDGCICDRKSITSFGSVAFRGDDGFGIRIGSIGLVYE